MHYQHLHNFINNSIRKNDIYVPAMILFLIKNDGHGSKKQISRLIYIFEYKHDLVHYDTIVEKFAAVMLKDYNIVEAKDGDYYLKTWPLSDQEIENITKLCLKITNGFFSHIKYNNNSFKEAS